MQERKIRMEFVVCLAIVSLSFIINPVTHAAQLETEFSAEGLSSLKVDGVEVLADGAFKVARVVMADGFRDRNAEPLGPYPAPAYAGEKRTFTDADVETEGAPFFDPNGTYARRVFNWGTVTVAYEAKPDRLDFNVTVENNSDSVIELVSLQLLEIKLPSEAQVERPSASIMGWCLSDCNVGGPDLRRGVYDGGQVVWLSCQPNRPMRQRLESAGENKLILTAAAGSEKGGTGVYNDVWDSRPIKPGGSDTYKLSLRFAAGDASPYTVAEDVFRAFGEAFPQILRWPDRRPICPAHIGDARRKISGGYRRRLFRSGAQSYARGRRTND